MSSIALITGASSGIGAVFARELAAREHDLLLVARRREPLQALADELQARHGISAEVLLADLADETGVARVEARVAEIGALGMLVNNAGFGASGKFVEADFDKLLDMIHVHVLVSVRLCRAALPGMIAQGSGGIINLASLAAFLPLAGSLTYSATKAYLLIFSRGLQAELEGTGVKVQALCPGFTVTGFHTPPGVVNIGSFRVPRWMWMEADKVVAASLKALEWGRVVCVPGLKNRLLLALMRSPIPSLLSRTLSR